LVAKSRNKNFVHAPQMSKIKRGGAIQGDKQVEAVEGEKGNKKKPTRGRTVSGGAGGEKGLRKGRNREERTHKGKGIDGWEKRMWKGLLLC